MSLPLQCSRTCGSGIRRRAVACFSMITRKRLEDSACNVTLKPAGQEDCTVRECFPQARWRKGEWSKVRMPNTELVVKCWTESALCNTMFLGFPLSFFFSLIMYQCYVCDVDDKSQNVWWRVVYCCYCFCNLLLSIVLLWMLFLLLMWKWLFNAEVVSNFIFVFST